MRIVIFGYVIMIQRSIEELRKKLVIKRAPYEVSYIEDGLPNWYLKKSFKEKDSQFKKRSFIEKLRENCLRDFASYPSIEYSEKLEKYRE